MRVIAGSARRLLLKTIEGMDTRPTTDRIKETLFNMLNTQIAGCTFLDLFSGSGAIGIEALSRGAKQAFFVESNPEAVSCIRENLSRTHLEEGALVLNCDVIAGLKKLEGRNPRFDIIFMDIEFGDTIGFQVARRLSMQDSQLAVVYMTNYEHYITEAFVCRPLGFIRKSHAEDDLQIAGQEIRRFIGQKYSRFVFGGGAAVVEVPLYKVYAVEIYGHDMVILLENENIRVRDKLMRVEDELEAHDFVKISRGRMVHLKYVTAIEGKTVQLHENYEFAVSADKISMLKSRWLAYKMLH